MHKIFLTLLGSALVAIPTPSRGEIQDDLFVHASKVRSLAEDIIRSMPDDIHDRSLYAAAMERCHQSKLAEHVRPTRTELLSLVLQSLVGSTKERLDPRLMPDVGNAVELAMNVFEAGTLRGLGFVSKDQEASFCSFMTDKTLKRLAAMSREN